MSEPKDPAATVPPSLSLRSSIASIDLCAIRIYYRKVIFKGHQNGPQRVMNDVSDFLRCATQDCFTDRGLQSREHFKRNEYLRLCIEILYKMIVRHNPIHHDQTTTEPADDGPGAFRTEKTASYFQTCVNYPSDSP